MKTFRSSLLVSALAFSGTLPAHAALLSFTFDTTAGNETSLPAQILDSHLAPAAMTRGTGFVPTLFPGTFAAAHATATTLSNALAAHDYFSFNLTPTNGYGLSLTSLITTLRAQNSSPTSPTTYVLMSDTTGFATGQELATWTLTDWGGSPELAYLGNVAALQHHNGPIELRLYCYGRPYWDERAIGDNQPGYDLFLDGSTSLAAIPEPASLGLVVVSGILIFARRKG